MAASDFRGTKLKVNIHPLMSHMKMDKGKVALIFRKNKRVIQTKETFLSTDETLLKFQIAKIAQQSKTRFRGWKTQFQPRSLGSRIFLVFS